MTLALLKRLCGLLLLLSVVYVLFFSGMGTPLSAVVKWVYSIGAIGAGIALLNGDNAFRWAWISALLAISVVAVIGLALLLTALSVR